MHTFSFESPVGNLNLESTDNTILRLSFNGKKPCDPGVTAQPEIIRKAVQQLKEYFNGRRKDFSLPLAPEGTDFQMEVWKQLQEIPYGSTTTYSQLSEKLGNPKAIRAIGRANGQNPIPIIIPCHRVVGANNELTGYSGGIERKRKLLQLEGALLL